MTTQLFKNSFHNHPKVSLPIKKAAAVNQRRMLPKRTKSIVLAILAIVFSFGIWFGLSDLNAHARIAFITFGLAILGWSFTKLNDTYVALAAALTISLTGVVEPNKFFTSLGDSTIWLMMASFIIAAGVAASGLSNRLTQAVVARVSTVNGLFYGLTAILLTTAFIIPATSGRAALMLPVFIALSAAIADRRINIALSILFPTIILLSAVASLTGAGAHLVTAEIVSIMGGEKFTFARWMMLGLPFALVSCFASTFFILRLFLNADERGSKIQINTETLSTDKEISTKWSAQEKFALGIVVALVAFWMTESLHGINSTMIALVGAMVITLPKIGTIKFKDGIKPINWNLLIFMAATLEMGEALIESGAAKWLVEKAFASMQSFFAEHAVAVVFVVAIVSLLSHLLINSRTARSSVLVPMVVLFALSLNLNATALAFISTAAAGFCLTLTVSAKSVMMFSQHDGDTFQQNDLLRLSAVLLPLHLLLLIVFAFYVYPLLGLDIYQPNNATITSAASALAEMKNQ